MALVLALPLVGCGTSPGATTGGPESTDQVQHIRLGVMPYQDYLTVVALGDAMGWFEAEGLQLDVTVLDWYDKTNEALASNSVDIASSTLDSRIGAAATFTGAKQFMLGYSYEGFGLLTRADSDFKTYEDVVAAGTPQDQAVAEVAGQLKGKTVIFPASGSSLVLVASTLAAAGLSLDDINVVDMNVDQGLSAFLGGNGDFYLGGTPQRVKAVKEGNRVLVDATNLPASAIELAGFAATDQFIADHSDALLKFIEIWYRGINYVKENPDDGYQRIVDKVNEIHGTEFLTVEDLAGIWNKVEYFPESACAAQDFFFEEGGARYWRQSFEAINTVYLANGSIKQAVLPEEVLVIEEFQQKALEATPC